MFEELAFDEVSSKDNLMNGKLKFIVKFRSYNFLCLTNNLNFFARIKLK